MLVDGNYNVRLRRSQHFSRQASSPVDLSDVQRGYCEIISLTNILASTVPTEYAPYSLIIVNILLGRSNMQEGDSLKRVKI